MNTPAARRRYLLQPWNGRGSSDTKTSPMPIAMLVHPSNQRTVPRVSISVTYQEALREHLVQPDAETLQQARDLGQAAKAAGVSASDLIRLHHQALADWILTLARVAVPDRFASALDSFLLEVLSPFEDSRHRASGDGDTRPGDWLEHLYEISVLNAELQEEIADRQREFVALQASKDHYFQLYQNARAMEELSLIHI